MTELRALLEARGIRKAVVIDDVFDAVPRPDELNDSDWTIFFDDLGENGGRLLSGLHPGYDDATPDELKNSQEFITVVWENRASLPPAACDPLFGEYQTTKATERTGLDALVATLEGLGLTCMTMGREFDEGAKEADLLFVDLFLGFHQSEGDMGRAVCRVSKLVEGRTQNPPLVVLMSRSSRLWGKRNEFRDNAGLLGSTFRVVSKADLAKDGTLETILMRLARPYEDARRIAGFVHAWDRGLDQARKNFIRVLRRLDLQDLAQIRALLLDFEGQNLGEYLLDVADRVLQHEIEDDDPTIEAARQLNKIDLSKYPAPHLAGSPDLQDLVHRMVFLHSDRLRLSEDDGKVQLQFGDLLRWKKEDGTAFSDDVSLVITPACDLVRDRVERVMLLSGTLEGLEPKNWSYKASPLRTAIVMLPEEGRKWIRWKLKDVKALKWSKLDALLGEREQLNRVGRLREVYAVEIQQKMLADMGRIGQPANPPATFPVSIALYVVSPDTTARSVPVEELTEAVCFVGRGGGPDRVDHLVLNETACDALRSKIQKF